MAFVRMVQVSIDQVIDVVSVRNRLVPAVQAMPVRRIVRTTGMTGRASVRIRSVDGNAVLVEVVAMGGVQMPVVQVNDTPAVPDGGVSATCSVDVGMAFVNRMPHKFQSCFECSCKGRPAVSRQTGLQRA